MKDEVISSAVVPCSDDGFRLGCSGENVSLDRFCQDRFATARLARDPNDRPGLFSPSNVRWVRQYPVICTWIRLWNKISSYAHVWEHESFQAI